MIDWSKLHCGVHQGSFHSVISLMPEVTPILESFPEDPNDFTWDIKVHMLMPNQYPCIPNWHCDNVPRVNKKQDFGAIKPDLPMYLWISGAPYTQFEGGFIAPNTWYRFSQLDKHRGSPSQSHCWRGFIRASHKDILPTKPAEDISDYLRRHCQVYLNAENFEW